MSTHLRRKKFIDRDVQGAVIAHLVRYWILSIAAAGGLTFLGWMFISPGLSGFVGPRAFMVQVLPMMLVGICASTLVLPLLIFDLVRVSHRFAGPLVRLRRQMREAADGGPLEPLHFRDVDFWPEVAEAYNDLLARFESEDQSDSPVGQRMSNEQAASDFLPTDVSASMPDLPDDSSIVPINA